MNIKAIFFDLDGTLRHSLPPGAQVFADYVLQLGLPITPEDRLRALRWESFYWAESADLYADKEMYPVENADFWRQYARRQLLALGASELRAGELFLQAHAYMEASYRPQSVVPEDALQLLPRLQEFGYRMAVVSNREKPFQTEVEALGLTPYFGFSLAGGEIGAWKPEPEIFFHACRRADVEPAETVYVGDNYFADVVGARRAGLRPVLYDPRRVFPDADCPVLTSFEQLPDVLEDL